MPPVELRTTSASAAARAERASAEADAAGADGAGAHRAPVATVVGERPATVAHVPQAAGKHAAPSRAEDVREDAS